MIKGLAIFQNPHVEENMSNLTNCASGEASVSSTNQPQSVKKKRNQPGHPDPDAEVIALSPRALLATNRFVCEICKKGFQRDQNLQLHKRGHNLPWKLKQRSKEVIIRKKVYVCPESSCVHHDPSRALGDLTGIKKHFFRKHGEKKWKCDKCSKKYAVQSDLKAHSKTCGTKEYRCDCGTLFSRRDSFITHRAFCDALSKENSKTSLQKQVESHLNNAQDYFPFSIKKEHENFILRPEIPPWLAACPPIERPGLAPPPFDLTTTPSSSPFQDFQHNQNFSQNPNPNPSSSMGPTTLFRHHNPPPPASPHISATALLQKAAQMGAKCSTVQCPSPAGVFIRPHQGHVPAGGSGHIATTGFGLDLSSSREEFIHGLASYGIKAAAVTGGGTSPAGASAGGNSNPPPPPPSLLHGMMMNNPHLFSSSTGFEGSTFEDIDFGGILSHPSKKDDETFHATPGQVSSTKSNGGNEGGGDDNMTRDFLGLRHLSESDILSITGFTQLHEQ